MVVVVAVQGDRIELELAAIFETHLGADSVEGILNRVGDPREQGSAEILLVGAVVIKGADAERGVVVRTRRTRGLNGVAALRIALQVELIGGVKIDVLGVACSQPRTQSIGRIGAVDNSHGPDKIAVVRRASEFDTAL